MERRHRARSEQHASRTPPRTHRRQREHLCDKFVCSERWSRNLWLQHQRHSALLVCLELELNWPDLLIDHNESKTLCYPVVPYYSLVVIMQWFFIFSYLIHFIWSNCFSSLKNKKFDWIIQFEIIIECDTVIFIFCYF